MCCHQADARRMRARQTDLPTSKAKTVHACHAQIARRANLPHARGVVERPKSTAHLRRPAFTKGALRDRHERRKRDAMDAAARATSAAEADGEVVWSWRPWAGVKFANDDLQTTVTKKSWTPRRARSSVNTIAQGRFWYKKSNKINDKGCVCSWLCRDPRENNWRTTRPAQRRPAAHRP